MAAVASPTSFSIPDALANLASAMLGIEGVSAEALGAEILRVAPGNPYDLPPAVWESTPSDLMAEVRGILGCWPPVVPNDAAAFGKCVVALELLDRWLAPLAPDAIDLVKSPWHHEILDLQVETDRLNFDKKWGYVVPHSYLDKGVGQNFEPYSSPLNVLAILYHLLSYAAFIPASVIAGDPNGAGGADVTREIAIDFRRLTYNDLRIGFGEEGLRVALSPGVEAEADAVIVTDGKTYTITPTYDMKKIVAIVDNAISQSAHILLMPEMSLSQDMLRDLCLIIPDRLRQYYKETGEVPTLSAAAVGVIKQVDFKAGELHRNYLALINSDGNVVIEQDKLSHWNLNEMAQSRFGVDKKGYDIPLVEGTVIGKKITVADIEGIGRAIGLICADMAHDMPGDWLTDNIGLDVIYAPIMDGSTCWSQGVAPWIIKRSVRSCRRSGVAVVVTNSLVMTHWNNNAIDREVKIKGSSKYARYSQCGIGFMVKRGRGDVLINHVMADIESCGGAVSVIDWGAGWNTIGSEPGLAALV